MLIRILNKLGLVTGIWLEDFQYEVSYSILRTNPSGQKWAYKFPFIHISRWVLNDDGSIDTEKSDHSYMRKWGYIKHHE